MREVRISRRDLLKMAAVIGGGALTGSLWPARVESRTSGGGGRRFCIVHFTDIHVQPELNGQKGFAAAVKQINGEKPDFAMSGGDLVFDCLNVTPSRNRLLWEIYSEEVRRIKSPVYQVMGNHDNFGLSNKEITPDEPGYGKQEFLSRFKLERPYYRFEHKGWRFIALDSILPISGGWQAKLDGDQWKWLQNTLAEDANLPAVIILHVPVVTFVGQITGGPFAATARGRQMEDAKELRELFEASNVRLVLQGHNHIREQFEYNGVRYITSGAVSGRWWRGPNLGHPEGFGVIEFDGENFTWRYRTFGWKYEV